MLEQQLLQSARLFHYKRVYCNWSSCVPYLV